MGFVKDMQKSSADSVYAKMKKHLVRKDGYIHVVMINSFSKFVNQNFECESKYTTQIDSIVTGMQLDGYEIVDIKFDSLKNQGLTGAMEGFHTLITYK